MWDDLCKESFVPTWVLAGYFKTKNKKNKSLFWILAILCMESWGNSYSHLPHILNKEEFPILIVLSESLT